MKRLLILLAITTVWPCARAVDATGSATEVVRIGRWKVIEFAATRQLIYRISSTSINESRTNIVFDFVPMLKCDPTAGVMISEYDSYNPVFDEGIMMLSYKPPGQKESTELAKTAMQRGDTFAFFQFQQLTPKLLQQSKDKGSLAVWIPGSEDGTVKRSSNIYFSLDGFTPAADRARQKCRESR